LGLNCNFSCGHCLNSSKPGNKNYDISQEEVLKLLADIKANENIRYVSFSGGEPLLYLDFIKTIISGCRELKGRDIYFSVTSNGSLIKKFSDCIRNLKINFCTLSYDASHQKFIDIEEFRTCVLEAKEVFDQVELNVAYKNLEEISLVKDLAFTLHVKVNLNQQIASGRGASTANALVTEKSNIVCPSMEREDSLKITYLPKVGYSVCCGPILFDGLAPREFVATDQLSNISNTSLYKLMNQLAKSSEDLISDVSCNKCRTYFLKNKQQQGAQKP